MSKESQELTSLVIQRRPDTLEVFLSDNKSYEVKTGISKSKSELETFEESIEDDALYMHREDTEETGEMFIINKPSLRLAHLTRDDNYQYHLLFQFESGRSLTFGLGGQISDIEFFLTPRNKQP